jgi:hypothetical protein
MRRRAQPPHEISDSCIAVELAVSGFMPQRLAAEFGDCSGRVASSAFVKKLGRFLT